MRTLAAAFGKRRDHILLAFLLGFALSGFGQLPAASPNTNAPSAPPQTSVPIALGTFHSDLLDLSLTYPGSLVSEKLPSLEEQHAATARKQPADEKPEYRNADQCTDQALLARRQDNPATARGTVTIYGDTRGTVVNVEPAVNAKILIARMGIECMPAEYRDHLDAVAAAMAEELTQGPDLRPIDHPIWYEVGKTRVHFAAAQNATAEKQLGAKSDEKDDRLWVASVAFVSNGNLVTIYFESNDLPFLNEALHGELTIGKQSPAPLFPAGIGAGTPLKPKP